MDSISFAAEERVVKTAEAVTTLLEEYGIRVPEDVEAEVMVLLSKSYADVEEKAWMYEDLCN